MLIVAMVVAMGCRRTPDAVIGEDEMASLLADVYTGEAVIENSPGRYTSDSVKRALQQSIYMRHGVTAAQVDTSLSWYGQNLSVFMDVCKKTEEILQERIEQTERFGGTASNTPRTVSMDGDSVDLWPSIHLRRNAVNLASEYMPFVLFSDKNWERGDRYTLSTKGVMTQHPVSMTLAVDYNDGTTEYTTLNRSAQEHSARLRLVLDSTKVATSVYGFIHYRPSDQEVSYLDSITLVRTRGHNDNATARQGQLTTRYR